MCTGRGALICRHGWGPTSSSRTAGDAHAPGPIRGRGNTEAAGKITASNTGQDEAKRECVFHGPAREIGGSKSNWGEIGRPASRASKRKNDADRPSIVLTQLRGRRADSVSALNVNDSVRSTKSTNLYGCRHFADRSALKPARRTS